MEEEVNLQEFEDTDDPVVQELQYLRLAILEQQKELQEIKEKTSGINWTIRAIAFALGVIMLFGVKLTFQ